MSRYPIIDISDISRDKIHEEVKIYSLEKKLLEETGRKMNDI